MKKLNNFVSMGGNFEKIIIISKKLINITPLATVGLESFNGYEKVFTDTLTKLTSSLPDSC